MTRETFEYVVGEEDTALALGSGDLPVLATPRLVLWLERTTHELARRALREGQTTVGTLVRVEHLKASPVGRVVIVHCENPVNDGRRLIFHVSAVDDHGEELATGEVHRRVIDGERFMRRFDPNAEPETVTLQRIRIDDES